MQKDRLILLNAKIIQVTCDLRMQNPGRNDRSSRAQPRGNMPVHL